MPLGELGFTIQPFFFFIHQVECEDIGQLVKIRVGHDNNGMRSAWFLEKVK